MSATTGTQVELLYTLNASITKNTFSTQAVISQVSGTTAGCKIPAGWLLNDVPNPVGRSLRWLTVGTIANTAAATFAPVMGIDPTFNTVATGTSGSGLTIYAATAPTAALTSLWELEVFMTCTTFIGTTATFQVNGVWTQTNVASAAALSSTSPWGVGMFQSTVTLNPAVDNFLELFATWSASSASNTTTVQQQHLWGLN